MPSSEPLALTIGAFDPVHADHVALFRRCADLGSVLVGVNSDKFYRFYRGKDPVFTCEERMAMVVATGYAAIMNDGAGRELIESVRPYYLVVGNDWLEHEYLKQIDVTTADLQRWGVTMVFTPRGTNISGTELRERLQSD